MARPLYVSISIRSDLDELWRLTQEPASHERWDARFSSITYEPREDNGPQRFRYTTRLGFGLAVNGWGSSVASRVNKDDGVSSLTFGSDSPLSLIRQGSGYWKYTHAAGTTLFETGYDYSPRWSWIGRLFDAIVFRPLIGWATAWSFDRLRLWIERDIDPTLSMARTIGHTTSRLALALVFAYHGLVPKLIALHPEEIDLLIRSGAPESLATPILIAAGIAEMCLALILIVFWRARWLYVLCGVALLILPATALIARPDLATDPFSPISLSIALIACCIVGWVSCVDLPSARRCARRKPEPKREPR